MESLPDSGGRPTKLCFSVVREFRDRSRNLGWSIDGHVATSLMTELTKLPAHAYAYLFLVKGSRQSPSIVDRLPSTNVHASSWPMNADVPSLYGTNYAQ
jgi:hypothetical protein